MSDIDAVIRRSRQKGNFSERKEFSIARERAVQKMRQFALKSPSYFVLEFIQGAVANGATYLDISHQNNTSRIAWTGGFFSLKDLQQIFDYLFADKEDYSIIAIRQLALGINALLTFGPKTIIIESGDGSIENSARIEIDPKTMNISSGRPDQPIKGTYIFANKLKSMGTVLKLIEDRCLTLSIPIIVNDRVLFGYSSIRTPNLLGVKKSLKFDEGDLYGVIGISKTSNTDRFKILTHGVWIQTVKRHLGLPQTFGGIITFDELNKTADHAAIVEDEKWDEMWARVALFARELVSGQDAGSIFLQDSLGKKIDLVSARGVATKAGGAILFVHDPKKKKSENPIPSLISDYEKIYGFPGFLVDVDNYKFANGMLVGNGNLYHAAGTHEELGFLKKPKADKPKGPFFAKPIVIKAIAKNIDTITVYTPRASKSIIEFIKKGRIVHTETVTRIPDGFLLRVSSEDEVEDLVDYIPKILSICESTFRDLSLRIADDYAKVIQPRSTTANHALRAMITSTIFSIDNGRFSIRRLGLNSPDILNAPILINLLGDALSIHDILELMTGQFGLVYGCVDTMNADLTNLDARRILDLTPNEEKSVIEIFGEASYIRVDSRDILAESFDEKGRKFTIRDMAVGLGVDSNRVVLTEGKFIPDPQTVADLSGQLIAHVKNENEDPELRRQSLRHLIWMLTHPNMTKTDFLNHMPLFRTSDNSVVPFFELSEVIEMIDGWPMGPIALPNFKAEERTKKINALALNPYVFHTLSRKKKVVAQSNHQGQSRADLRKSVVSQWLNQSNKFVNGAEETLSGTVCLMPRDSNKSFTMIRARNRETLVLETVANRLMCAGELIIGDHEFEHYTDLFIRQCVGVFGKTANLIWQGLDPENLRAHAEPALFGAIHLITVTRRAKGLVLNSRFNEVNQLLHCKIFPTRQGVPVSAMTLTSNFESPLEALDESAPKYQREWLSQLLNSQAIGSQVLDTIEHDWKKSFLESNTQIWVNLLIFRACQKKVHFVAENQIALIQFKNGIIRLNTKSPAFDRASSNTKIRDHLFVLIITHLFEQSWITIPTRRKLFSDFVELSREN